MEFSKKACAIAPSLTLKIDAASKAMRAEGMDVVGFGAGEPDFDTPDYIKAAAHDALDRGYTKYTPASGTLELKRAVCARMERKHQLEYQTSQIVISNGAKHSLFNIFAAALDPGDEVIIFAPYWVTYPELVRMNGGVPVFVETTEENGFNPRIEDIRAALTPRTKALLINSPSNPCGAVYPIELLAQMAQLAKENDLLIVSDEIYDELVYEGICPSIATVSEDAQRRTVVVNGMSKAYAMTGWRIGYTCSCPELAKIMGSYQSHATSNPCSIAQYASVTALDGPQDDMRGMVEVFAQRRLKMVELINAIPNAHCRMPKGAFYCMMYIGAAIGKSYRGKHISDSLDFAELLLENELTAVVPGAAFGADDFVRLSYATSEANIEKGLERIARFMSEIN